MVQAAIPSTVTTEAVPPLWRSIQSQLALRMLQAIHQIQLFSSQPQLTQQMALQKSKENSQQVSLFLAHDLDKCSLAPDPIYCLNQVFQKTNRSEKPLGPLTCGIRKTLESASVMDSDDFFAGDFSKQIK